MDSDFDLSQPLSSTLELFRTDLFLDTELGAYPVTNYDNLSSVGIFQTLEHFSDFECRPQSSQELNISWDTPFSVDSIPHADYDGYLSNITFPSSFGSPLYQEAIASSEVLAEPRPIRSPVPRQPKQRAKASKPTLPGTAVLKLPVKRRGCSIEPPSTQRRKQQVTAKPLGIMHPRTKRAPNGSTCIKCKLHNKRCDNKTPCSECMGKIPWQPICIRAKLNQICFSKHIYRWRVDILLANVEEWVRASVKDLVRLEVGFEFPAILPIYVNRFVPKSKELLDHISFRISDDVPLDRSPSEPWGLLDTTNSGFSSASLAAFLDEIIPDMLKSEAFAQRHPLSRYLLQLAYRRCMRQEEKQANLLRNLLRMWAAQSSFFERAWRIRGAGAAEVNARFHETLRAADVPRMLYWQLDYLIENYLSCLEKGILDDFDLCIFPPRTHHRSPQTVITVFIAAFAYLMVLESDTWNLKTWETKAGAWEKHPFLSRNPTMVWPVKGTSPNDLIKKNEEQADAIANHVKALNHGRCLSTKDLQESNDDDVRKLGDFLEQKISDLGQLRFRGSDPYQETDSSSLDYTYISKILLDPEGPVTGSSRHYSSVPS